MRDADERGGVNRHIEFDSKLSCADTCISDAIVPHEVNCEPAFAGSKVSNPGDMGRTDSEAPGYAPEEAQDEFDPLSDDFVSKERKYLHFDRVLSEEDRALVRATDQAILAHAFWPLLGFTKSERRAKKDKHGQISFVVKPRDIKFGSHSDAALLEAYTRRLSLPYERKIKAAGISNCVLAYRRDCGDNIIQAKTLFDEIESRENVNAIGLDITKFFDNITHSILLKNLKEIFGKERLSAADHKIYRRMTAFEWVESDKIGQALSSRRTPPGRICSAQQFREIIRSKEKLINVNRELIGIPQGTPLSGLYANISLLQVDIDINFLVQGLGGSYRRYSDDIAILIPAGICPNNTISKIKQILDQSSLEISSAKTIISKFSVQNGRLTSDTTFQYLGFTFDGQRRFIRQSSINRYYAKMSRGIRSKVRAARKGNVPRDTMFLRQLYKSYTHFGRYRNFPRYAYRAAKIMEAPEIRRQLRHHVKIFKRLLLYYLDRAY